MAWPSGSKKPAAERGLPVIDATCPLVAKVHNEGRRYARQDREIVLVGHAGHAEVEGTIGQVPAKVHLVQTVERRGEAGCGDPEKLAYITQTTLSVDDTRGIISALKSRFPHDRRAGCAGHLLCDPEPPASGAGLGAIRWILFSSSDQAIPAIPTACERLVRSLASHPI